MKTYPDKIFKPLSDFKNRAVTLYRSCDTRNTSIYFTESSNKRESHAAFEILHFEYAHDMPVFFIKFIGDDFFTAIKGGGGSARGNMRIGTVTDIWNIWDNSVKNHPGWNKDIKIYEHDGDILVQFGEYGDFNFLKLVARQCPDKSAYYFRDSPHGINVNLQELDEIFSSVKYLALPEDVSNIQYAYKTEDICPMYIVIDSPRYNFSYNNHRFRIIENNLISEMKIKSFSRMCDGGTTEIIVVGSDDKEYTFFSPSSLCNRENKPTTFNDIALVEVTEDEEKRLINLLGILIEPDIKL